MKILRVIASMDPTLGGPSQGIRNMIPALEQLGVHNEVVCLDDPDVPFLKNEVFPIHALGESRGKWHYHPVLQPWLIANLGRFDIVIVHGLWLYHGYALYRVLKKMKAQHVAIPRWFIMPHGMLDPWFQKAKARRWKSARNWLYWKLIESKVIHSAEGLLFTCEEELRLAKTTFAPYHPKKELNVGYGIQPPPEYIPSMKEAFREKAPEVTRQFLLFLSRIHPKKGTDLLIKAYIRLKEQQKDLPQLVIAGPGLETAYGQQMRFLAASEKDIIFTGMLWEEAKWGALYGCEAFLLPSHQENFGIAVVEALACGKPVLISDQVNIWREVSEAQAGYICEDNEEAVYESLKKIVTTKEKLSDRSTTLFYDRFIVGKAAQKLVYMLT